MGYLGQVLEKTIAGIFRPRHEQAGQRPCEPSPRASGTRLNIKKAEKIVNEYGIALERASYLNRIKVTCLLDDLSSGNEPTGKVAGSLQKGKGRYHDLLTMKCEKSLLPYPKETIQEAIYLLLEHDADPENIRLLQEGLRYLENFL